jgi:hypothetical protein
VKKEENPFLVMREEKKRFIPKSGFNVVGVDDFEPIGEALYLVGHYSDRAKAEARAAAHSKESGDACYVYAAPSEAEN